MRPAHPDRAQAVICLATLRPDGFVSLDAGEAGGSLATVPFRCAGDELNANTSLETPPQEG